MFIAIAETTLGILLQCHEVHFIAGMSEFIIVIDWRPMFPREAEKQGREE